MAPKRHPRRGCVVAPALGKVVAPDGAPLEWGVCTCAEHCANKCEPAHCAGWCHCWCHATEYYTREQRGW